MKTPVRLLTIWQWAEQSSVGTPCAECQRWLAEAPDAPRQWALMQETLTQLQDGGSPSGVERLSAEQVAEYLEGSLDTLAAREVELACWKSPAQMAEVLSAARFQRHAEPHAGSASLHRRLRELSAPATTASPPTSAPRNGKAHKLPVAPPLTPPIADENPLASREALPTIAPARQQPRHRAALPGWSQMMGAVALALGLMGALLWLVYSLRTADRREGNLAGQDPTAPVQRSTRPETPQALPPLVEPPLPPPLQTVEIRPETVPSPLPERRPAPEPEAIAPSPPRPIVPVPEASPTEVAIDSAVGAVLIDYEQRGVWRVGRGKQAIPGAARVVSLAESYSLVKIPGLGTLVLSGAVEATFSQQADGAWLVRLEQGRLGVNDLPVGQRLLFESGGVQWTTHGLGEQSTVAVINDPGSPTLFVPRGAVAVDGAEVGQDQVARWAAGVLQPPESLSLTRQPVSARSLDDGLDGHWLQTPEDKLRREWITRFGRLTDRLAAADDAALALDEIFASSKDPRQAALAARWRLQLSTDPRTTWETLNDRRAPVRQAAVRHLIDLPQRDLRTANISRLLRTEVGDASANRMGQWLTTVRTHQTLVGPQATEMADGLGDGNLAVRQIAVSLLELHTQKVLQRARLAPPAYDAAATPAKRAIAQREWTQIVTRLYANRPAQGVRGAAQNAVPNIP